MEKADVLRLPSVMISDCLMLPDVRSVYYVVDPDNEILYIGQSVKLKTRWSTHLSLRKMFPYPGQLKIYWHVLETRKEIIAEERREILEHKPRLNSALRSLDLTCVETGEYPGLRSKLIKFSDEDWEKAKLIAQLRNSDNLSDAIRLCVRETYHRSLPAAIPVARRKEKAINA